MLRLLSLLVFLVLWSCTPKPIETPLPTTPTKPVITKQKPTRAKNVILMIGDGMGLTQITAGMYSNGNKLNLERCKYIGLHKSYASDNLVTDSAAGATAFAAGVKTYNGAIGVDRDTMPVETILEEAEKKGLATGLVATSTIVHATPASFYAHVKQRKMYEEIAADFLKTDVDLFIGGGKKYFDRRENDDRNLYTELTSKGYNISDYFNLDLKEVEIEKGKNFAYLTSDADPLPFAQGRDYLVNATEKAIDYLDDQPEEAFFLMVEGSQIDWGGHANNSEYIISEMIEFDEAIGKALDFAKKDGNTLVVITADHETGGYAINPGSTMDTIIGKFTSDYHTATMIPVFAFGPGEENFGGIYENTEIYHKMRAAYGWKERERAKN
ncbi:MAG: alkaline phosphatase [Saprospiraceae bacterium]